MPQILGKHWRFSGSSWTKFVRTPTCWIIVGKTVRGSSVGTLDGKSTKWECLFVHRKQRLFFLVYVDEIKEAGKKQHMARMWKKLMKKVDFDEPTSILGHVYLGCTQRDCKPSEIIVECRENVRITNFCWSNWTMTRVGKTFYSKTVAWSYDMEGHAQ